MSRLIPALAASVLLAWASPLASQTPADEAPMLVIAHRGASAERPEHTRAAYELAIAQGAHIIEPDLVMSRDGVLVVRHENALSETTDVADRPEFADRRRTQVIDGTEVTDWFTEDFTLAELRTLRARERLPQLRPANEAYDGQEAILTLAEVIALVQTAGEQQGRTIGLYPELKHPSHFRALGLNMEEALVAELAAVGWTTAEAPVFIQCFEWTALVRLNGLIDVRLVFLMARSGGPADLAASGRTYAALARPEGLAHMTGTIDALGVEAAMVLPRDEANQPLPATSLVADARAAGLEVHVWTLRPENYFLAEPDRRGDPARPDYLRLHGDMGAEVRRLRAAGVTGLFTDAPSVALAALSD